MIAALSLAGCLVSGSSSEQTKWSTGFWFWRYSYPGAAPFDEPLDVLFVEVGQLGQTAWSGEWPDDVPRAREYWLVYRYERQNVPDSEVLDTLAVEVTRLQASLRKANFNVAGVQLDIDSPTSQLCVYAAFLREFRKKLPKDCQMSITALLDWFRAGTRIDEVISEVDEFVPQFYDVDQRDYREGTAIASPIDAARWGPVFNRFGKRFRIGVSTFGRARMARSAEAPARARDLGIQYFGDLAPIDLAADPRFVTSAGRNAAAELILTYRATQNLRLGYTRLETGDAIQFILATPETVRAAVDNAKRMQGHVAGVLFFRWPTRNEALTMQPGEALRAAGAPTKGADPRPKLVAIPGDCVAVSCQDLYLDGAAPFASDATRYRIHSSSELEYFLAEKNVPVRMTAPAELVVSIPPYSARGSLYLGRAVTTHKSSFKVQTTP